MTKALLKAAKKLIKEKDVMYEEVLERVTAHGVSHVLHSKLRKPTIEEVAAEIDNHASNRCNGTITVDDIGWLYDFRSCAICDRGLGTV